MSPLTQDLQLTPEQRRQVQTILKQHLPQVQAWVFGSRATGRARPFSDLDILLTLPTTLSWDQRAQLRDAFENSDLPFKVDVVEADRLEGPTAERVRREMRPLVG